jgi:hypothetical protein
MKRSQVAFVITLSLCGIAMGILVLFAFDMLYNNGSIAAHSLQRAYPGCDSGCHAILNKKDAT